ncbi:DoxX family protein [Candidatus Nomurabacteria bacterium RIFCSPLOWO2_02_FULL_44_12]|uniref:DoxX family protein n=1 Tax=Candidatus Nomurabacteria bacterium RIFCSPLOWO2_12_FULL_44_11 TaxID=1801796 RepID=A0A1F6Y4M0_9BACT|nr:MAG: DoxX family protein [Candidatus Nomurabacteria bacterium RIFCSPHIGHO2_12_FULL_44_22b]OGJ01275.1 MAG: DoxX family protein [Candidatus Nomurabacteria bacterium RIFCSPLOWO2_12_FULL_44_11]OGJ08562.1 MAG: DoxX family protein [Candidatus Nomurabacteria bacterium RIFCSPLOWO2_02_FULL_44_12]
MIYIFLLGRVLLGGYFIMNGYNHIKNLTMLTGYAQSKGVPMPKLAVFFTGLLLLLGGAGVLLGVYVECAVLFLSIFLVGVTFQMHQYWKVSDPMQRMGERVNFYKNLGLLGGVLMLLAIPTPWAMSLF